MIRCEIVLLEVPGGGVNIKMLSDNNGSPAEYAVASMLDTSIQACMEYIQKENYKNGLNSTMVESESNEFIAETAKKYVEAILRNKFGGRK